MCRWPFQASVATRVPACTPSGERVGHAPLERGHLAEGLAVDVALDAARDDLLLAVMAFGVDEKGRDQQRLLHHLAEQGMADPPGKSG